MAKLEITSINNEDFGQALGITDSRMDDFGKVFEEIQNMDEEIAPKSLSDIGAYISKRLDLTPNEIFFIGYKLNQMAHFASMADQFQEMLLAKMQPMGDA